MGRKTDVLLRGFRAAKCLTLLKLATGRIKVMRNKRSIAAKQMRAEIAHLLKSGQDAHVYITKADALIKQENMVAVFDIIDQYCHAIIARFPMIEMQGTCPIDMRGPIASLIYAAPRCPEISELAAIKEAFTAKYGKEFAGAAGELRPDSGVNKQVIELLSTRPATGEAKLKIMKEICAEYKVDWTPGEALGGPSTSAPAGSSQQLVKMSMDAKKATGDPGSTKATPAPVGIAQVGPSKLGAESKTSMQGASKHDGIHISGNMAMDPSKYPSTKPVQGGDSGKAKETAAQSVKGDTTPGISGAYIGPPANLSLKSNDAAAFAAAASASKSSSTTHLGGGLVAKANERPSQSLTGASTSTAPLAVKFGLAAAMESLEKADGAVVTPAHLLKLNETKEESMGRFSFSNVQSLKGERITETSIASSGHVKGSKAEAAAKAEHDVQTVVADSQNGSSDSDNDSFVSVEEGLKDDSEISSIGGAARRESFGKSSLQDSVHGSVIGPSLIRKSSKETTENRVGIISIPEDAYSKPGNQGSSLTSSQEYVHLTANRINSLNIAAAPEENIVRAESRKSSFREDKISGLAMGSSLENTFLRESSKNNSSMDAVMEENAFKAGSGKSILKEKQGAGEQSFKQAREDILTKQQQSFKVGVEEGVPRKDITTGSSILEMLVEAHPFKESPLTVPEEMHDNGLHRKDFKEDNAFVAITAENVESLAHRISAKETPTEFGEGFSIEGTSSDIHESSESGSKQMDEVPSIHIGMQEVIGPSSSGAPAAPDYDQDFAAAVKAIAAEAARLAVQDYAKRVAGSSSIPVDLPDLTSLGLDLEGIKKVSQDLTNLKSGGNNEVADSREDDCKKDVIREEASKVEITVHGEEGKSIDETGGIDVEKMVRSNTLTAVDEGKSSYANQKDMGHVWPSTDEEGSSQQFKMASGEDAINPFASKNDKTTNSLFVSTEDDVHSSWLTAPQPEVVKKAGGFGQEEDHLDVFFNRKTPRFDEDGYGFGNATSSFLGERVSFPDYKAKESIFQDNFVPSRMFGTDKKDPILQETFAATTSVFDSLPESKPSTQPLEEESSGSFKVPVFDDEGPDDYDASFSLDDGPNKSDLPVGRPDLDRPVSPSKEMPSLRFDPEPEPIFDKMEDREEQVGSEKMESAPVGQLKWQSKKQTRASDQGEAIASGANTSLSRRTRKSPQRMNEQEYGGSDTSSVQGRPYIDEGLTGKRPQVLSSTLVQQQFKDQHGRIDKYDVGEQGRTRPAASYAYSNDTVNRRPSSSSKRGNEIDRWDSTSTYAHEDRFSSGGSMKSPARSPVQQRTSPPQRRVSPLQQRVTVDEEGDEDFYFAEETGSISSGYNRSKRSTKSPTRVARPPPRAQSYDEDDEEGYNVRYKPSRRPTSSQQDLFEHESIEEEPSARSKPLRQRVDLAEGTSAGMGMYRRKQHLETEVYESELLHPQYVQASSDARSRVPTYRKQDLIEEESYQPSVKVHDRRKNSPSRPLSSRRKGEGEEPHLTTVLNSSAQGDDLGNISSKPLYGRRAKQGYHEEEEQGFSMAQHEQEEPHAMRLPDRHQGERYKEKERMPRTSYRQKQDLRMEDERLHSSSIEDDEWEQDVKSRPLPSYTQERRRRPLPQYEQDEEGEEIDSMQLPDWQQEERHTKGEERMPRPRYGWKQDTTPERKNPILSMENYEQQQEKQQRPSMSSSVQESDTRRRPSPYGHGLDSKFQEDSSETWQLDNTQQEQKRPASDRRPQQRLAEKTTEKLQQGRENERLPSPVYTRQQERDKKKISSGSFKDQLQEEDQHQPLTSFREGKQEHVEQRNDNRPLPSQGQKQQPKFEEKSESRQQKETRYQQQDKLTIDGRKQESLAKEESMKRQQEKSQITEQLPAGQSIVGKEEGVKGPQEKPYIKTQPPSRRSPSLSAQPTSPSLESFISDPIILATIPPPVKKPVPPAATTIASSVSAPASSAPDVKAPKVPQKPPNVEDLLANFEALKRARKGE